jgi:hypothetical protein
LSPTIKDAFNTQIAHVAEQTTWHDNVRNFVIDGLQCSPLVANATEEQLKALSSPQLAAKALEMLTVENLTGLFPTSSSGTSMEQLLLTLQATAPLKAQRDQIHNKLNKKIAMLDDTMIRQAMEMDYQHNYPALKSSHSVTQESIDDTQADESQVTQGSKRKRVKGSFITLFLEA